LHTHGHDKTHTLGYQKLKKPGKQNDVDTEIKNLDKAIL